MLELLAKVEQAAVQKTNSEAPMKTPAIVNSPIRQALGIGDGRTLSVVKDMPGRSPVGIIITLNRGVTSLKRLEQRLKTAPAVICCAALRAASCGGCRHHFSDTALNTP
jgi:hypothetical protein